MSRWFSWPAVAVGALGLAASFPKFSIWPLAWIALVPLFLIWRQTDHPWQWFGWGIFYGMIFFGISLQWLVETVHYYGGLPGPLSLVVIGLLAAWCSLFVAAVPFMAKWLAAVGIPWWAAMALAWVGTEYLRGVILTGFPWVLLGYSQIPALPLIQIAELGGIWLVSLAVAIVNSLLAEALILVREAEKGKAMAPAAVALVLPFMLLIYGSIRLADFPPGPGNGEKVGLIQANIPQDLKWDRDFRDETVEIYQSLTRQAADDGASLVVWPEAALPFYFQNGGALAEALISEVVDRKIWLLFGSPGYDWEEKEYRLYNRAYLMAPTGETVGWYDKTHLVPYGEYVPLNRLMPFIEKMVPAVGDLSPGSNLTPLKTASASLGVVICYEDIFPGLVRRLIREGAELLVAITNDAWFGRRAGPYQHWEMARVRAVEHRRPLVRAANTGLSGVIDAAGRVTAVIPLEVRRAIVAPLPKVPGGMTPYTRFGDALPLAVLILAGIGIVSGRRSKKRIFP